MKPKYDKFLTSYVVSKRAKEILEERIHYLPKEQQNKNEILEAIKEIEDGIINIEVNKVEQSQVKEEEDTLELLYSSIKKQKAQESNGLDTLLEIEENEANVIKNSNDAPTSLWEEDEEEEDDEFIEKEELLIDDLPIEEEPVVDLEEM